MIAFYLFTDFDQAEVEGDTLAPTELSKEGIYTVVVRGITNEVKL